MIQEIGSEFHRMPFEYGSGLKLPVEGDLVFSGRTAIETVLKEIPNARKALLPSYCCDSMIQPFQNAGIEVDFYSVYYDAGLKITVGALANIDVFLWCNYFGFDVPMPDLSDFGGVVIEDITHSLLSDKPYHTQSQYLIASLRKWEPINCGGYCASVNGELRNSPTEIPPESFIDTRTLAMKMKKDYLSGSTKEDKSKFLSLYVECNHWLAENYSELSIDQWSQTYLSTVDVEKQKNMRRNNARVLYKILKDKVQFLFAEADMDCPLFVPILLKNRDEVRRQLTNNQIYCPVHWPKPSGCESNLYKQELSLVCDQRYTEEDMKRVASVLTSLI